MSHLNCFFGANGGNFLSILAVLGKAMQVTQVVAAVLHTAAS